jgi:hypothetical protein
MADYPISPVVRRVVYTASAGVGPYAFTFEILAQTDIDVYVDSTLKTLTTDYTVTINANGTGEITFVSAPTSTARVTIVGARSIERATDFVTGGDLTASSLNLALDQNVIFSQQNAEALGRAILAPVTDPSSINMVLPAQTSRAGKVLSFNSSTGNPETSITVTAINDAATNAAAAAASASAAASSASAASSSASSASSSASAASSSASAASSSASSASSSASAASSSASAAASSEIHAASSETAAAGSASAAASSASSASSSASAAAGSASTASSAQAAAEAARDATLAAYDNFDDRYLGAKSSDPSVDNDGNALVAGALYFNTTSSVMKLYTGSAWVAAYVSGADYLAKANNLSDLVSAPTARINIGIETGATGSTKVASGTAAQRDGSPAAGYFRFNTDVAKFEGYNGTAWGAVGGGATGGGSDAVFVENDQVVTTNYTIPSGKNAMSTGPVTVNSGVTVTVSTGSRYVVI